MVILAMESPAIIAIILVIAETLSKQGRRLLASRRAIEYMVRQATRGQGDRNLRRSTPILIALSAVAAALLTAPPALAQPSPCPGNPDALSTSRIIVVDAATTPRVGRKHFPQTLPL